MSFKSPPLGILGVFMFPSVSSAVKLSLTDWKDPLTLTSKPTVV